MSNKNQIKDVEVSEIIYVVASWYQGEFKLKVSYRSREKAVEKLETMVDERSYDFTKKSETLYVREEAYLQVIKLELK